jgi:hypothetical protein
MSEKVPLTKSLKELAKKVAAAYKSEIVAPAEEAIRDWMTEISQDENPYSEDKITK